MAIPDKEAFLVNLGSELRELREKAGLTQEEVADVFGWHRDAMSKVERGINSIQLRDYLILMRLLRDVAPWHPALPLADRILPETHASRRA